MVIENSLKKSLFTYDDVRDQSELKQFLFLTPILLGILDVLSDKNKLKIDSIQSPQDL